MKSTYDAVIVGSGPAGATCALYAAHLGLNVLLVDRARFPRDKVCGDAIPPRSAACLGELGLLDALRQAPHLLVGGVTFSSPNGDLATIPLTAPDTDRQKLWYMCRREVFDNILFQAARERVEVREGFSVEGLYLEGGRVCGVAGVDSAGTPVEIKAEIVVGADGSNSVVGRRQGMCERDPGHWVIATRAYYRGVKDLTDALEIHFTRDVYPGYFWIFPLEDGLANVGLGMLHGDLKKRKINLKKAHLAATTSPFFRARFQDAEMLGSLAGWTLPLGSKRRTVHGDGFVLVGDAAGLVNPFTGEGIGNAMCSGKLAAETIADVGVGWDGSRHARQPYANRLWATLGPELRLNHSLQQLSRIRPLLNLVINRAARRPEVRHWISTMMLGSASKRELKSPMTYLRLLFS